jgi:hypothetical protein
MHPRVSQGVLLAGLLGLCSAAACEAEGPAERTASPPAAASSPEVPAEPSAQPARLKMNAAHSSVSELSPPATAPIETSHDSSRRLAAAPPEAPGKGAPAGEAPTGEAPTKKPRTEEAPTKESRSPIDLSASVQWAAPAADAIVTQPQINLLGTAPTGALIGASLGRAWPVTDGWFSVPVSLREGKNELVLHVKLGAQSYEQHRFVFYLDGPRLRRLAAAATRQEEVLEGLEAATRDLAESVDATRGVTVILSGEAKLRADRAAQQLAGDVQDLTELAGQLHAEAQQTRQALTATSAP